jgi:hypothetical protein
MRGLLLIGIVFYSGFCFAQTREITGIVKSDAGEPLPFVSISIKGTNIGTSSDISGMFRIALRRRDSILVFTAIGYETKQVFIKNSQNLEVNLVKSVHELNEVVVTGLSAVRKKSLMGFASAVVTNSIEGNFKTWKRSGIDENSVKLYVGDNDVLPLKAVQVGVKIDGFRARILFDYYFYNDRPKRLRGNFRLKLPAEASPYYLSFGGKVLLNKDSTRQRPYFVSYTGSGKLPLERDTIPAMRRSDWFDTKEAIVVPKEKANYAFNEVVRGNVDPAILQWAGADIFSCSLFPLEPGKMHRVIIGYDVNLASSGNNMSFELQLPYENIPKKLDVDIAQTNGLIAKITPQINQLSSDENFSRYRTDNFSAKSFTISFRNENIVGLATKEKNGEQYFALNYTPEWESEKKAVLPGKAIFMLDLSLSSRPDKFHIYLKILENILRNNKSTIKQFAVILFNVETGWWRTHYSSNNDFNIGSFMEYADKLNLVGATDLAQAFREATSPAWNDNFSNEEKSFFLLSDGDISWGDNNLYQLSALLNKKDRVFAFNTGISGTDLRVLSHFCRQTNGAMFTVLNEDEVEKAATAIQNESWTIQSIKSEGLDDILIAGRPQQIFQGQQLQISGRGKLTSGSFFDLQLTSGEKEMNLRVRVNEIIASSLATRIYGQAAVNQLDEFSFQLSRAAEKYAAYYFVPGQSSSLLLLDNNEQYKRYQIERNTSAAFVDSNQVNRIITNAIEKERKESVLGSSKAAFNFWISKMAAESIIKLQEDSLHRLFRNNLSEKDYTVLISPLHTGLYRNTAWYPETEMELTKPSLVYDRLFKQAKREKSIEGTAAAFKLLSSFVEHNRSDLVLMREIAFELANWKLNSKAYELLNNILRASPAEPNNYLMLADNLYKMNHQSLALLYYEICYLTDWDNRFDGFKLIAALRYKRILEELLRNKNLVNHASFIDLRLKDLNKFLASQNLDADKADMMVIITWNTDNTDVDLHVKEPSGEVCNFKHMRTASGGFLSNDATDGFGPEMYFIAKAAKGKYRLSIDYYSSSRVQTEAKSKILLDVYKYWGTPKEEHYQKIIVLKKISIVR